MRKKRDGFAPPCSFSLPQKTSKRALLECRPAALILATASVVTSFAWAAPVKVTPSGLPPRCEGGLPGFSGEATDGNLTIRFGSCAQGLRCHAWIVKASGDRFLELRTDPSRPEESWVVSMGGVRVSADESATYSAEQMERLVSFADAPEQLLAEELWDALRDAGFTASSDVLRCLWYLSLFYQRRGQFQPISGGG